jgi:hypothetical protein
MDTLFHYALGALVIWLVFKSIRIGGRESYLPSGPPTVPILGNLNAFPKLKAYLKYVCCAALKALDADSEID